MKENFSNEFKAKLHKSNSHKPSTYGKGASLGRQDQYETRETQIPEPSDDRQKFYRTDSEATSGSANEIRMKMEETRSNMNATLDSLGQKLQPKSILQNIAKDLGIPGLSGKEVTSTELKQVAGSLAQTAKPWIVEHPISSALIASGLTAIGLEASGFLPNTRQVSDWGKAKKQSIALKNQLRVEQAKQKVSQARLDASIKLDEAKARAGASINQGIESSKEAAKGTFSSVIETAKKHPFGFGLAAAGAGLFLASKIPQLAGQRRKLKQAISGMASSPSVHQEYETRHPVMHSREPHLPTSQVVVHSPPDLPD